jgi:hypothetical protein
MVTPECVVLTASTVGICFIKARFPVDSPLLISPDPTLGFSEARELSLGSLLRVKDEIYVVRPHSQERVLILRSRSGGCSADL